MLPAQGISLPVSLSHHLTGKPGANVHDATAVSKLKETAKEFEATFLSMLIKEMRQTDDEEGGLFPGDSGDIQGGLFDLFMGQHLAHAGGIGLAAFLERQMNATHAAKPVTSTDAHAPATRPAHNIVPSTPRR
jgi:peptidoglycan hydrolase FlgJ